MKIQFKSVAFILFFFPLSVFAASVSFVSYDPSKGLLQAYMQAKYDANTGLFNLKQCDAQVQNCGEVESVSLQELQQNLTPAQLESVYESLKNSGKLAPVYFNPFSNSGSRVTEI